MDIKFKFNLKQTIIYLNFKIMTHSMDLNKFDLIPITEIEMQEIDGGFSVGRLVRGIGLTWAIDQVTHNWTEIKKGFSDGIHNR